jgi:hypothetical protein
MGRTLRIGMYLLALSVAGLAWAQPAPAPAQSVPLVVKTEPATLKGDVDPGLSEITVTFNQVMKDRTWSWTGGGETYPKSGSASYDPELTTCTLPVTLEPGKVYWVGINSPSHRNFKSEAGVPARRYVVLFATRTADGQSTRIPPQLLQQARAINAGHQSAQRPAGQKQPATRPAATQPAVTP